MNKDEIKRVLELACEGEDSQRRMAGRFADEYWVDVLGYDIKVADRHGGFEGSGEDMWVVVELVNQTSKEAGYVEFSGLYSSYSSPEWNAEYRVVKPVEVKVTQWEEA